MISDLDQSVFEEIISKAYKNLFNPDSIAIIGASDNISKPGGRVLKNIKEHGYQGKLWAVNTKGRENLGLPTFPSIDRLPAAPDLAILSIPSNFVLPAVEELASIGTPAVIVLTAVLEKKTNPAKRPK